MKDEDHSSQHLCHQILVHVVSVGLHGVVAMSADSLIIRSLTAVGLSLTGDTCRIDKICLRMPRSKFNPVTEIFECFSSQIFIC